MSHFIGTMLPLALYLCSLLLIGRAVGEPLPDEGLRAQFRALELRQRKSEAEIESLKTLAKDQQGTIQAQQQQIDKLEHELKTQREGIKGDSKLGHVASTVQQTQQKEVTKGRRNRRQERTSVAFSAYIDHTATLGRDQTIQFNRVITNDGGAYNHYTGLFTCPTTGLYLFSFAVGTRGQYQMWAKLVVDNVNELDAAADGVHVAQDMQGGNTVVLRLSAGQSVWIETYEDMGYDLFSNGVARFTSFTGVLLY